MAEEGQKEEEKKEGESAAEAAPPPKPSAFKDPNVLLGIVNTLAIIGALGMMVYVRLIFERPKITEPQERAKLEEKKEELDPSDLKVLLPFEEMTLNIAPRKTEQGLGKYHFLTVSFALELHSSSAQAELESVQAVFLDRFLSIVGKKGFHELNTVQGRYILRAEIIDMANALLKKPIVSNILFTRFVVQ